MEQQWTSEQIKQILLYVKELQQINEDLRAGIIAMEAKLQTATSSGDVNSKISVHKFEDRMVPKFF